MTSDLRLLGDCERLSRLCQRLSDAYGTKQALRTEKTFQELERRVQGLHGAVTDEYSDVTAKRSYKRSKSGSAHSGRHESAGDSSITQHSNRTSAVKPDHNIRTGSAERQRGQRVDKRLAPSVDNKSEIHDIVSNNSSQTGASLDLTDTKYAPSDLPLQLPNPVCDNIDNTDLKNIGTREVGNTTTTSSVHSNVNDLCDSSVISVTHQKDHTSDTSSHSLSAETTKMDERQRNKSDNKKDDNKNKNAYGMGSSKLSDSDGSTLVHIKEGIANQDVDSHSANERVSGSTEIDGFTDTLDTHTQHSGGFNTDNLAKLDVFKVGEDPNNSYECMWELRNTALRDEESASRGQQNDKTKQHTRDSEKCPNVSEQLAMKKSEKNRQSITESPHPDKVRSTSRSQRRDVEKSGGKSRDTSIESGYTDQDVRPRRRSRHRKSSRSRDECKTDESVKVRSRTGSRDSSRSRQTDVAESEGSRRDGRRRSSSRSHREGTRHESIAGSRKSSTSDTKDGRPAMKRTSRDNTPSELSGDDYDSQFGDELDRSDDWSNRRRSKQFIRVLNTSGSTGSRCSSDDGHIHDSGIHSRESRPSPRHSMPQESRSGGLDSRKTSYDSQASESDVPSRGRRRRRMHNRRTSSEYMASDDYYQGYSSSREDMQDYGREIPPRKDRRNYPSQADYSYDDYSESDVPQPRIYSKRKAPERPRRYRQHHRAPVSASARASPAVSRDHSYKQHRRRSSYDIQYNEFMSKQYDKLDSALGHRPDSETRKVVPNGLAQLIQQALWIFEDLKSQGGTSRQGKKRTPETVDTATDTSDMDYVERPSTQDYSSQTIDSSFHESRSETSTPDNILEIVRKEVHKALEAYEKLSGSNMSLSNISVSNTENENESDNYEHLWTYKRQSHPDIPVNRGNYTEPMPKGHYESAAQDKQKSVHKDTFTRKTLIAAAHSTLIHSKSEHDLSASETDDSSIYVKTKPPHPSPGSRAVANRMGRSSSTPETFQDFDKDTLSRRSNQDIDTNKGIQHPLLGVVDNTLSITSSRDSITNELANPDLKMYNSYVEDDSLISGDASASDITLCEIDYTDTSNHGASSPTHFLPSRQPSHNDDKGALDAYLPPHNTNMAVGGFRPVLPKHSKSAAINTLPNSIHFFPTAISGQTPSTSSPIAELDMPVIDMDDSAYTKSDPGIPPKEVIFSGGSKLPNSDLEKRVVLGNDDQTPKLPPKTGRKQPSEPLDQNNKPAIAPSKGFNKLNPNLDTMDSTPNKPNVTTRNVKFSHDPDYNIKPQNTLADPPKRDGDSPLTMQIDFNFENASKPKNSRGQRNDGPTKPREKMTGDEHTSAAVDAPNPTPKRPKTRIPEKRNVKESSGRHTPVLVGGITSPVPGTDPDESDTADSNLSNTMSEGLRTPQPRRRQSSIVRRHSVKTAIDRNIGLMTLPNKPNVDTSETTWVEDLRPRRPKKTATSAKPGDGGPTKMTASEIPRKRDKDKGLREARPPKSPAKKVGSTPPSSPKKDKMKDKTWKNVIHIPSGHFCFKQHYVPPEVTMVSDKSREILRNTIPRPKTIIIDHKGSKVTGVRALTSYIPIPSRSPSRTDGGGKQNSMSTESLPVTSNRGSGKIPRQLSQSTGCLPNPESHLDSAAPRQVSRSTESLLETHRIVCAEMEAYRARSMEALDTSCDSIEFETDTSLDTSYANPTDSYSEVRTTGTEQGGTVLNATRHGSKIPVLKSQSQKWILIRKLYFSCAHNK